MKRKYLLSTAITLLFGNEIIQAAATPDCKEPVTPLESSKRVECQKLEQYDRKRIEFQERGTRLHDAKCAAFDSSLDLTSLSPNYEIGQLTLISDIINHYKTAQEDTSVDFALKAKWAHSDLRNISISVGLLADFPLRLVAPLNSPYSNPNLQHASFFRDLRYLQKLYADGCPKKLTEDEARWIMENSSESLLEVCSAEIAYAKKEIDETSIATTRTKFRDHTQTFPVLYSIVAAKRDLELLAKAISTIERVKTLDFSTTNENQKLVNRAALLGALIVIGEGYTQKNLSPQSSSNAPTSALQKFRTLRNKLAHVEWDANSNNLSQYFTNCNGDKLVKDLDEISKLLTSSRDEISALSVDEILQKYSTAASSGLVATPSTTPAELQLAEVDKLLVALPQKSLDKTPYTPEQKKANLKNEIEVLREILSINGNAALTDPFPENLFHLLLNLKVLDLLQKLNPGRSLEEIQQAHNKPVDKTVYCELETVLPSAKMDLEIIKTYHDRAGSEPIFSFLPIDHQSVLNVVLGQADEETKAKASNAIKIYARRCQLKTSLIAHPERLDAALYQFGKIAGLIKQIPENQPYNTTSTPPQELRAFRNYVEHSDDLVDASGISSADLLIRYISIVFSELEPKLK